MQGEMSLEEYTTMAKSNLEASGLQVFYAQLGERTSQ